MEDDKQTSEPYDILSDPEILEEIVKFNVNKEPQEESD